MSVATVTAPSSSGFSATWRAWTLAEVLRPLIWSDFVSHKDYHEYTRLEFDASFAGKDFPCRRSPARMTENWQRVNDKRPAWRLSHVATPL